ncbi:MAG: dihydrodipicolinate synthase family protein, partial [Abditibacteriaceae bacterium]
MNIREHLLEGQAIPACPLALDENRRFDERHQRALARYYVASGAGGLAVAVHSTQFEIREPKHALLRPVLELVSQTIDESLAKAPRPFLKVSGVCGGTKQAVEEAQLSRELGYEASLLSLAALKDSSVEEMLQHVRKVAREIPIIGFYLQPSVGGRILP